MRSGTAWLSVQPAENPTESSAALCHLCITIRTALNLEYDDWYSFLGNKKMVAALLDRLRHHCHTIRIDGPTLRTPDRK